MKGTGLGSFEGKIEVKVAERDIATAQEKLGVARIGARAITSMTIMSCHRVTGHGNDETVTFELGHMLGLEIKWQVLWAESEY